LNYLNRLGRNISRIFMSIRTWVTNYISPPSSGRLNPRNSNSSRQLSPRKFDIVSRTPATRQNSMQTSTTSSNSGKFKNYTATRPATCPLCRTLEVSKPGNIFRRPDNSWGCKSCDHQWRG
jgi:hypothetical protein